MILKRVFLLLMFLLLTSCAFDGNQGTIAELEAVQIELKDADVDDGLDKAMQGYQKFLAETPESQLTPEALRRLADLKIEKEYGIVTDDSVLDEEKPSLSTPAEAEVSTNAVSTIQQQGAVVKDKGKAGGLPAIAGKKETEKDFEKRATGDQQIKSASSNKNIQLPKGEAGADLQNAGAEEAIRLYRKLLDKYPTYERNDQVLYQLSRAYEEVGKVDEAMNVMNRLVKKFPRSRYTDEVQFRRGEYYFTRKKYLDAEDAYGEVLKMGVGTVYYERALYKKGWAFYKQELYEEALKEFFELLDYKVSIGYDFEQTSNNIERKRIGDTLRVVSLSFSNLGGAASVQEFFTRTGARDYEYNIYGELAEFFFEKRRYNDAATTYNTFIESNPFHKKSPHYSMRVIDIYLKGRFPKLVIEAKKQFASTYGLEAEYWGYFDQAEYPEVLGFLKTNISDLANHFHSLYQNKKYRKKKHENYVEASHWYKEFLKSFPKDEQSPGINYQLADLYLENKDFKLAAIEFERSAYDYPVNDKSQKAAYAAIYSYREHLKKAPVSQIKNIKREIIRTTLRLVDTYPSHEKATVVLGAATDDLFEMRDFTLGIKVGRRLIEEYPKAESKIIRGAWLVVAHSSYEIEIFNDAEVAYQEVLRLTATDDKTRVQLIDNLAASIYKQGEQARTAEDYKEAVRHFLRIADVAPLSTIRPTAEYDAAAVLLQVRDLEQAVSVLLSFRSNYPDHKLQRDVTRKVAFAYKELEKFTLAAREYERIAVEADTEDLVREAMLEAAELYEKAKDVDNSLRVYKRFVVMFPKPLEFALETYYKIALIHKTQGELKNYRDTLQHIIDTDKKAGGERTDRTRYLAAQSSLIIIEPNFDNYIAIKLVKPFKRSLKNKQKSMKSLVKKYTSLVDYQVADVTAASTYYIAEIYFNFNRSLMESEKPDKLSEVELEEFNLMVEEQAFPFEEKAIQVHEKNIELLSRGIYSKWIDRSIDKLAMLIPARYGKSEETISFISKIDNYIYNSPRYAREDASTGILNNLFVFRYVSQKLQSELHKTRSDGDIDSDGSVNQVNIGVEVPENTSDSVRDSTEVPSSQKAGPEETSAQTQTSGSELNDSELNDSELNDSELNRSPEAENTSGDVGKEKTESEIEQDTQVATDTQESLGENTNQITGDENVSNDSQMESSTKNSEEVVQSEVEVEGQVEGQVEDQVESEVEAEAEAEAEVEVEVEGSVQNTGQYEEPGLNSVNNGNEEVASQVEEVEKNINSLPESGADTKNE